MSLIAIFIFYKKASGIQACLAFNDHFKHCNIVTFDGADWIMLDFDRSGLLTRRIKVNDAESFLRNIRIIPEVSCVVSVEIDQRKKISWKPFWVRSCNEICRYASGIDLGFTFNPIHFYRKLLKYRHKRNYALLSAWRRDYGISRRRQ